MQHYFTKKSAAVSRTTQTLLLKTQRLLYRSARYGRRAGWFAGNETWVVNEGRGREEKWAWSVWQVSARWRFCKASVMLFMKCLYYWLLTYTGSGCLGGCDAWLATEWLFMRFISVIYFNISGLKHKYLTSLSWMSWVFLEVGGSLTFGYKKLFIRNR